MLIQEELDTHEITSFLNNTIPNECNTFLGCFARDVIPWSKIFNASNCSVIVNTDLEINPGQHFICIIKHKNTLILWDSFGSDYHYSLFLEQMPNPCNHDIIILVNTNMYQSIFSKGCGYFCIWFILWVHFINPNQIDLIQLRLKTNEYIINEEIIRKDIHDLKERFYIQKCLFTMMRVIHK